MLVDGNGVPLSIVVDGANRHDMKLLGATLDATVIERPRADRRRPQHLCLDAGYAGLPALNEALANGYEPHIRPRGEEIAARRRGSRPRRWVVERTLSWLNRFRKLLVCFEKTAASHYALLSLAAALICWRQTISIYG